MTPDVTMVDLLQNRREPRSRDETRWLQFHRDNPEVYRLFCHYTQMLLDRNFTKASAWWVVNQVRWFTAVEINDPILNPATGLPVKISNLCQAYYARLWMEDHPNPPNFFATRELKS